MVNQETMWLQYLNMLNTQVSLESGEALQSIYPYQTWDWGGQRPVDHSYSYEQFLALNVVPATPGQNSSEDAGASQSGFDLAYQNWFDHLAIGDLAHDKHYQQLQDDLNNANTKYTDDYLNAKNVWKNETGGNGESFEKWLNDPGQFGTLTQINEDKQNVVAQEAELDNYRKRIQTPINNITKEFANPGYQANVTNPNSGKSIPVRIWGTDPINPYKYVEQITGNNFGGNASNGKAASASFKQTSSQYDYSKVYGEGGAGVWDDFIMIDTGGTYEKIDWTKFSDSYGIEIAWQDLGNISVTPDQWFAGTNITSFGKGPYSTGFSEYQNGNDNFFFGPSGAICRIYKNLIVAYRPTITISAGSSFSSYLFEQFNSEDGILIGPFYFGSKQTSTHQKSTAKTSGGKITIQSNDDWPLIVGMISAWTLPPQS